MMREEKKLTGYALSRKWFDFVKNTTEMVRPMHTALYFWIIELNNRLQWKQVFGLSTKEAMEMIGLRGYRHYKKALSDLIRWGFITLHEKSCNQYTCNQISLNLLSTYGTKQGSKQVPEISVCSVPMVLHSKTRETIKNIEEPVKTVEINLIPKDAR